MSVRWPICVICFLVQRCSTSHLIVGTSVKPPIYNICFLVQKSLINHLHKWDINNITNISCMYRDTTAFNQSLNIRSDRWPIFFIWLWSLFTNIRKRRDNEYVSHHFSKWIIWWRYMHMMVQPPSYRLTTPSRLLLSSNDIGNRQDTVVISSYLIWNNRQSNP